MTKNNNSEPTQKERGNAFILVLIGVVLFAALSFTVARSMRSESTQKLSAQELKLAASEIRNYARNIESGIDRLRRKGVSETDICAFHDGFIDTSYKNDNNTNPSCSNNKNNLYHSTGGNVRWKKSPQEWFISNDPTDHVNFTLCTSTEVVNAGKTISGFGGNKSSQDAITITGPISIELCEQINANIGYSDPSPANAFGTTIANACRRSFGSNVFSIDSSNEIGNGLERCIKDPALDGYYYYYTVLKR